MTISRAASLGLLTLLVAACGDDSTTGSGGSTGSTGTESSTSTGDGDGGSGGASGEGGEGGTSGEGGAPPDVACGELTCTGGDACIETVFEPACTSLEEGDACPEGTTQTFCGGAGGACCCEEPPSPAYACATVSCSGEEGLCLCLDAPCEGSKQCTELGTPGTVRCEEPPAA